MDIIIFYRILIKPQRPGRILRTPRMTKKIYLINFPRVLRGIDLTCYIVIFHERLRLKVYVQEFQRKYLNLMVGKWYNATVTSLLRSAGAV
mgnify:CR=1 FL=1